MKKNIENNIKESINDDKSIIPKGIVSKRIKEYSKMMEEEETHTKKDVPSVSRTAQTEYKKKTPNIEQREFQDIISKKSTMEVKATPLQVKSNTNQKQQDAQKPSNKLDNIINQLSNNQNISTGKQSDIQEIKQGTIKRMIDIHQQATHDQKTHTNKKLATPTKYSEKTAPNHSNIITKPLANKKVDNIINQLSNNQNISTGKQSDIQEIKQGTVKRMIDKYNQLSKNQNIYNNKKLTIPEIRPGIVKEMVDKHTKIINQQLINKYPNIPLSLKKINTHKNNANITIPTSMPDILAHTSKLQHNEMKDIPTAPPMPDILAHTSKLQHNEMKDIPTAPPMPDILAQTSKLQHNEMKDIPTAPPMPDILAQTSKLQHNEMKDIPTPPPMPDILAQTSKLQHNEMKNIPTPPPMPDILAQTSKLQHNEMKNIPTPPPMPVSSKKSTNSSFADSIKNNRLTNNVSRGR